MMTVRMAKGVLSLSTFLVQLGIDTLVPHLFPPLF